MSGITLEEYKRAYREIVIEESKKIFKTHLIAYIIANIVLIVVNLVLVPEYLWFYYPLIGWGVGVTMHYLFGVHWIDKKLERREKAAEIRAREKKIEGQ